MTFLSSSLFFTLPRITSDSFCLRDRVRLWIYLQRQWSDHAHESVHLCLMVGDEMKSARNALSLLSVVDDDEVVVMLPNGRHGLKNANR